LDKLYIAERDLQKPFLSVNKKEEDYTMKKRIAIGVAAAILLLWVVLPDPMPIVIDDIIAALGSAAAVLKLLSSRLNESAA
jgi:hypothetical protein